MSDTNKINKSINILLIPYLEDEYYQYMLENLAIAFREDGHKVFVCSRNITKQKFNEIINAQKIDLTISINRFIGHENNTKIPLFCWIQDIFTETEALISSNLGQQEYIYTLGDPHTLGFTKIPTNFLGSLLTAANKCLLNKEIPTTWDRDFALCGYIPDPHKFKFNKTFDYFADKLSPKYETIYQFLTCFMRPSYLTENYVKTVNDIVKSNYSPLTGSLDINLLENQISSMMQHKRRGVKIMQDSPHSFQRFERELYSHKNFIQLINTKIDRLINYFVHTYPRFLDRNILANLIINNFRQHSIEFYGHGWQKYNNYKSFSKPHIHSQTKLQTIFNSTKINLNNNTHGFGLHSRVIDCVASGGFFMTHQSGKNDYLDGGVLTCFKDGEHFGFYDPNDFTNSINNWLYDDSKRIKATTNARKIIAEQHLWKNRSKQILKDYIKVMDQKNWA
jgi:hypothetical protein